MNLVELAEALEEHGLTIDDVSVEDGVVWKKEEDGSKLFIGFWFPAESEES